MEAVVLAGGAGKGLKAITGGKPKTLIPIAGKYVIEYVIDVLLENNIDNIVLVTDKPSDFEDITVKYGGRIKFDIRKQRGAEVIGAILTAEDELSKGAILFYGDTIVKSDALRMLINTYFEFNEPVILVVPEEDVRLYGAVKVSDEGLVRSIIEKPKEALEGYYAYGGIAILNRELIELVRSFNSLDKAINYYIDRGGRIRAAIWGGLWIDIGYPWNLLEAIYHVLNELRESKIASKAKISSKAIIEGPVIIEEGAFIDHNAIIRGPAYIGKNVMVGANTFIRPYTSIELESSIGSYVELVWSSIQPYATIGRASFLGYSVVGPRAVIEPYVYTKLLVEPERIGIKAIREYKRRREYFKIGSFIGYKARVKSYLTLEPGTLIS